MVHVISVLVLFFAAVFVRAQGPANEPISVVPTQPASPLDPVKVALGKKLFSDMRLSKTNTVSCASCHDLARGGMDGKRVSQGVDGAHGSMNAPSVYNSGLNFRQFWDGRAKTLEDQIEDPLQNPKEMGSTWKEVLEKLKSDKHYAEQFAKAFADGVTRTNIKVAIAEFERALLTPNSRFDRFLKGEAGAISADEREGYQRFKAFGCVACHQGVNVGGNMFQSMGVMGDYFKDRGLPVTEADYGRYNVTKNVVDKHVFRVPSLRNVALTAPYFHDGTAKTLEQAVNTMAKYQVGRELSKQDVDLIVKFLRTLTGEVPAIAKEEGKK